MALINVRHIKASTEQQKALLLALKRIVFDANLYIAFGKTGYIYGERCYNRAMQLLKALGVEYKE